MASPARFALPVFLGLAGLLGALPGPADESENYRRLEAMPRERRQALSDNLERFDKLEPAEQAAIRRLDAELAKEDPVDRSRHLALLRRYHLWVNSLPEDKKQKLKEAENLDARLNLAAEYRRAEKSKKPNEGPMVAGIRIGDMSMMGPYEAAHLLKIWQKLAPAVKADLEKRSGDRLYTALRGHTKALGLRFDRFPAQEEAHYEGLLDNDADFKALLGLPLKRVTPAKPADDAKKTDKTEKAIRRFEHPFAEFRYFEEHPPVPVAPARLERFTASCPSWFLSMLDPLSPDDALNYLTIVYRRLYPSPTEYELPGDPKGKPKVEPATGPQRPTPKKAQGSPL